MELAQRAYATFQVKALDNARRTFSGWATTPEPDRMGDTIDPLGAKFKNPLVLLHQHRHSEPIGNVTFGKPTAKGIPFDAEIPTIEEAGELKNRLDSAWGEVKHGLVRAVSIGFRAVKYAFLEETGGIEFQEIEIYELSTVSIPANAGAVITAVAKSMEQGLTPSVVRALRDLDMAARPGTVSLIRAKSVVQRVAPLPRGAVRLKASP